MWHMPQQPDYYLRVFAAFLDACLFERTLLSVGQRLLTNQRHTQQGQMTCLEGLCLIQEPSCFTNPFLPLMQWAAAPGVTLPNYAPNAFIRDCSLLAGDDILITAA
jgi:hypothetical protein